MRCGINRVWVVWTVALCTLVVQQCFAAGTIYVNGTTGSDNNDGLSPETAVATIQKGIDLAEAGFTVLVYPGRYIGPIDFHGKAITVRSADEPAILSAPDEYAVSFYSAEGRNSMLQNFIICGSEVAVFIAGSSPTIRNVTVVNNNFGIASYAGGNPDIRNSIFWNNSRGDLLGCTAKYSLVQQDLVPPSAGPTEGLVCHWPFDEANGGTAHDVIGSHDGTVLGAAWTMGYRGGSLYFDGRDDVVEVAYDEALELPAFTVSLWYRPSFDSSLLGGTLVGRGEDEVSDHIAFNFEIASAGFPWATGLSLHYEDNNDIDYHYDTGFFPSVGSWTHLAVTRSVDGEVWIYADGELLRRWTATPTPTDQCTAELTIGALWTCVADTRFLEGFAEGRMDDVRIYNRPLSAEEIVELVSGAGQDSGSADQLPSPLAHWKFDEGSGTIVSDSVGTNHGVIEGGALWTEGVEGYALRFDGEDDLVRIADDPSQQISTNQLTVSAWIKLDRDIGATQARIICKQEDSEIAWGLEFFGAGYFGSVGNQLTVHDSDGVRSWYLCTGPTLLEVGRWYHVAFTDDGGRVRLFIDGTLDFACDQGYGIPSQIDAPILIGCSEGLYGYNLFFPGLIDDVRLYDSALSPEQIRRIYQGRGSDSPLFGGPNPMLFADPNHGDFHLRSERGRYMPQLKLWVLDTATSPGIDGGDPNDPVGAEPSPNGGRINIGAYGGTSQASLSHWKIPGDFNYDGIVDFMDLAVFCQNWLATFPWTK